MSTVTVTDLVAGTEATSAGVNQTLASWNAATAAGQVSGTNVRVEGVDRWVMSTTGNVVEQNTSAAEFFELVSSGAVANTTGTPVVIGLNAGAAPMQTAAAITSTGGDFLVHASVRVTNVSILYVVTYPTVTLYLEFQFNGGAWTKVPGSRRRFRMRDTTNGATSLCSLNRTTTVPAIDQTVTWASYIAAVAGTWSFRATFETNALGGNFAFDQGMISPQLIRC